MKQFTFITIFFYCCTFASPPQAHAAVPAALIAVAAVGAVMGTTTAGTYYAQTGQSPQYVKTATDTVASAGDAIFQPSYVAQAVGLLFTPNSLKTAKDFYVGKISSVGASIGDIVDFVKNTASTGYDDLKNLITGHTTTEPYPTITISDNLLPPGGLIFDSVSGANYLQPGGGSWVNYSSGEKDQQWTYFLQKIGAGAPIVQSTISGYPAYFGLNESFKQLYVYYIGPYTSAPAYRQIKVYNSACVLTSEPESATPPQETVDYPGLADALDPMPGGAIAEQIQNAIKNLSPSKQVFADSVPNKSTDNVTPATLTAAEIAQVLKDNATAVAQAAATAAQEVVNAGATDAAAQVAALQTAVTAAQAAAQAAAELAKAQEEEAEKETQEKFNQIPTNSFDPPYDPGPFDIPTRFTTFLGNVKSSGLFSFSTAFFDSLPGGGSPVYTVDAGHYGSHTIDLSDTMSTGLAVLKSILLACFGFLSIRAVIMKR